MIKQIWSLSIILCCISVNLFAQTYSIKENAHQQPLHINGEKVKRAGEEQIFMTTADTAIVPFFTSFEDTIDVNGWLLSKSWIRYKYANSYEGVYCLNSLIPNPNDTNNWVFSRAVNLPIGTYRLEFYYKTIVWMGDPIYATFNVGFGTAQNGQQMSIIQKVSKQATLNNWVKNSIDFTITTAGVYYIGINHKPTLDNSVDDFFIDNLSLTQVKKHDVSLVEPISHYALCTPINHFGSNGFSAKVKNVGLDTVTNVHLVVSENSQVIGISDTVEMLTSGITSKPLSANINFTPQALGNYTFNLEVQTSEQDEDTTNNIVSFTHTLTDTTFATDRNLLAGSIGSNEGAITFGNIYTLNEKDTLTSVTLGFKDISSDLNFEIAVYQVINDSIVSEVLSVPAVRTMNMEYSLQTFAFNPRILETGRYLIAVRQLTYENIAIDIDGNTEGYFFLVYDKNKYEKYYSSAGNIAIRANFGHNPTLINQDAAVTSIVQPFNTIGTFSDTTRIIVRVKNYGLQTITHIPVYCKINNTLLSVQQIDSLAPNADKDISFTADLSAPMAYTVLAYTNLAADENRFNDTVQRIYTSRLITPAICWDFNQGMPASFMLKRYDKGILRSELASTFKNNEAWKAVGESASGKSPLCAGSPAWFTESAIQANRWMITPKIHLTTANSLDWDAMSAVAGYPESYEVRISTTGTDTADFNTILYSHPNENAFWTTRTVDLSAFANKDVYIAFVHNSINKYVLLIDNVSIYGNATGISDLSNNNIEKVKIYPNPAKDRADIEAKAKIKQIEMINIIGKTMLQVQNINTNHYILNMAGLEKGVYIINIETEQGRCTRKMVVLP